LARDRNRLTERSGTPDCQADGLPERAGDAGRAALYLLRRLGPDTQHYVRRIVDRLRQVGEIESADEWAAIGDAIAEHERTDGRG
jgi:hypothetical protein